MKYPIALISLAFAPPLAAQVVELNPTRREVVEDPAEKAEPASNPGTWVTTDDYPSWAARAGTKGRVVTNLTIEATGRVSRCEIVTSSGVSELDRTACEKLMERARFKPARDDKGVPVASLYEQAVRFTLPSATQLPVETNIVMEFAIARDGSVSECTVTGAPEDAEKEPCEAARTFEPPRAEDGTLEERRYRMTHKIERLPVED